MGSLHIHPLMMLVCATYWINLEATTAKRRNSARSILAFFKRFSLILFTRSFHSLKDFSRFEGGTVHKLMCFASLFGCLTQQACCCCAKGIGSAIPTGYTRLNYAMLFLLTASLSYLMLTDFIEQKLSGLTLGYFAIKCGDGPCHGVIAVYAF
jgi:hypothetical protein